MEGPGSSLAMESGSEGKKVPFMRVVEVVISMSSRTGAWVC